MDFRTLWPDPLPNIGTLAGCRAAMEYVLNNKGAALSELVSTLAHIQHRNTFRLVCDCRRFGGV
jgi:hypothetical protein